MNYNVPWCDLKAALPTILKSILAKFDCKPDICGLKFQLTIPIELRHGNPLLMNIIFVP